MFCAHLKKKVAEDEMANNSSNDSFVPLGSTLLLYLPVFTVNIVLLAAIITAKTVPAIVRVILTNIVLSSETTLFGLVTFLIYNLILQFSFNPSPSFFFCRVMYIIMACGAAGRLLFMATYAVTVYVLARYAGIHLRVSKWRLWPTLLAVVAVWLFATAPNMVLLSSEFFEISSTANVVCLTHGMGAATLLYTCFYISVYGMLSYILSIILPILTARYIKKNSISENKQSLKNMTTFSIFLLVGNSFSLIGTSLPLVLSAVTRIGEEYDTLHVIFNYLDLLFIALSQIIVPVILLIFFKPVRQRFKIILCITCLKVSTKTMKKHRSTEGAVI